MVGQEKTAAKVIKRERYIYRLKLREREREIEREVVNN